MDSFLTPINILGRSSFVIIGHLHQLVVLGNLSQLIVLLFQLIKPKHVQGKVRTSLDQIFTFVFALTFSINQLALLILKQSSVTRLGKKLVGFLQTRIGQVLSRLSIETIPELVFFFLRIHVTWQEVAVRNWIWKRRWDLVTIILVGKPTNSVGSFNADFGEGINWS
jgi:hypothetical protein